MIPARNRIAVYYSHGQDYEQVLEAVRRRYPDAYIYAIVPSDYETRPKEEQWADAVLRTERNTYSLTSPVAISRLVRMIRRLQCDRFIVLFHTMQLRGFAALSGAKQCECWGVDSRIHQLPATLAGAGATAIARTTTGWSRWLVLWIQAHLFPIKPRNED
jgi:hypothetical protein